MPKPQTRKFSKQDKLRILAAADACSSPSEVTALLRKTFQQAGENALSSSAGRKPTPSNSARLSRLERENARLQRELAVAKEVIALQKKVSILLQQLEPNEGDS